MARIEANGVGLAYEIHGSGDPVLLICGTGQSASTWDLHQIPALTTAGYQVVAFDNRGMAPSDCPPAPYTVPEMAHDAAALIEQLGIGPCLVAGYSLGAFITQELALERPDLVRGAVLIGTLGRQDAFRRALFTAWVEFDQTGIELPRLYDVVYSSFTFFSPAMLDNDGPMGLYIDVTAAMPPWTGPGRLGQHQADAAYDNRIEALSKIRVPTTVIGFELDTLTPPRLGREVANAIPGCVYREIPGAGHGGAFEKPTEVNTALLEFFAGI